MSGSAKAGTTAERHTCEAAGSDRLNSARSSEARVRRIFFSLTKTYMEVGKPETDPPPSTRYWCRFKSTATVLAFLLLSNSHLWCLRAGIFGISPGNVGPIQIVMGLPSGKGCSTPIMPNRLTIGPSICSINFQYSTGLVGAPIWIPGYRAVRVSISGSLNPAYFSANAIQIAKLCGGPSTNMSLIGTPRFANGRNSSAIFLASLAVKESGLMAATRLTRNVLSCSPSSLASSAAALASLAELSASPACCVTSTSN